MRKTLAVLLCALLAACTGPEPEPAMSPAAGKTADTEMLAEPVILPETCEDSGDGIGGTGCPID